MEKKGRGGKVVTLLSDLPLELEKAKELMRSLQGEFACGGTLKESKIELRGDLREKVRDYFIRHNIPHKG